VSPNSMKYSNKRLAILSPIAWRTPPRQYGAWETVASNVTEGLIARGWDVTLFASGDSVTRAHLHAVLAKGYEEDSTIDSKVANTFTSQKCLSTLLSLISSTATTTSCP
jgi:hypothetical protein